mmetsp:Transcript_2603/g.5766  ORF Transcript_2603/g.5766 Transcript_2603/m.5766 type:complete len:465 (+) Transcript_2603:101-1495(+)
MSVVALAAVASLVAVVPAAAFSPNLVSGLSGVSVSASARRTRTTANAAALNQYAPQAAGLVDVSDIYAQRDVYSMEEWAAQCGMQKAPGVEIASEDGVDYSLQATQPISTGQSVVYVPADIVLNSASIQQEFGGSLAQAEAAVVQIDQGTEYRLPLFRLMAKILVEYEKGQESAFYPWLNSLPKQFFNGVSMTKACTSCLPPYAGWLTSTERINYAHFAQALRQGWVPLSQETISNKEVVKWAYNVAFTRFHEVWQPERAKLIGPMADMLNHAADPNCAIEVDYSGNINVVALREIPAGSALTISYGDPTNPTPLFAQYGFLPQDCATIFCKAMHLEPQIRGLGYDFAELLFQTETGEIAPKVWDVFLYSILQQNDSGAAQQFYAACQSDDEGTKEQYNAQYFEYTLAALKEHVYTILNDCEELTMRAQSYDLNQHPRVPVIVAHNELVFNTFTMTAALLEQMG